MARRVKRSTSGIANPAIRTAPMASRVAPRAACSGTMPSTRRVPVGVVAVISMAPYPFDSTAPALDIEYRDAVMKCMLL